MKKKIALVLTVVMSAMMLAACGKFTCDICGEEKTSGKHTDTLAGEDITYCDDCEEQFEAVKALEKLAEAFS